VTDLNAEGRIRLYMELNDYPNISAEIAYDPRFKSEEWPRTMYAITRDDMQAVLAELEHLREVRNGFAEKLLDLDSANVKIIALATEAATAFGSTTEQYNQLKADYDKLEWMMEELRK
jgi:hypothetical protein